MRDTAVLRFWMLDRASAIRTAWARSDVSHALRCLIFVAALVVVWVSLQPFSEIGETASGEAGSGKLASTYLAFGLLAVVSVAAAMSANRPALRSFGSPVFVALAAWMIVNIAASQDVGISLQRFVLSLCAMVVAAMLPLLPDNSTDFRRWLAAGALILLLLCYGGIMLVPHLTVHLASDPVEAQLAGDWRGTFGHKNLAAPTMAMIVFVGLYLARSGAMLAGIVIVALSGIFLLFSHGKSATALCIATLVLIELVVRLRSFRWRAVICYTPLLAMNLFSLGTVLSDTLARIAQLLPIDTTFTGRTDIWRFGFEALAARPITGYGFAAFWGDAHTQPPAEADLQWATEAAHSHNGFLDTALTIGIPGVLLVIAIFVVAPLKNFQAAEARGNDGALGTMFLRIWLFGSYLASMESFFLDRVNPIWFTYLLGVFGLHYLARFGVRADPATPAVPNVAALKTETSIRRS